LAGIWSAEIDVHPFEVFDCTDNFYGPVEKNNMESFGQIMQHGSFPGSATHSPCVWTPANPKQSGPEPAF